MKKQLIFSLLALFVVMTGFAQDFPTMRGYWYNPATAELFVIDTEANGTVKGTGVYYAKGNAKFKQMQIMTQTAKDDKDGSKVYFLRVYAPNNPNMVYDLTSGFSPGGTFLGVTITGNRSKINQFSNLSNLSAEIAVSTDYLTSIEAGIVLRDKLFEMKFYQEGDAENLITFDLVEGYHSVSYKGKEAELKINPITHQITFNLVPFGNVKAKLNYGLGWQMNLLDASGKSKGTLEQMTGE